jgi:hypothetical protein
VLEDEMSERNTLEPGPDPDFVDQFAEPEAAEPTSRRRRTAARPSLVWPVLLIGAGVLLLLREFGYLGLDLGQLLWRYWPILLILVGIDLLFGRRSPLTTLLSVLLVVLVVGGLLAFLFLGVNLPGWVYHSGGVEVTRESIAYPLEGVREAEVVLDLGRWPTVIRALRESDNLIEGDVVSFGAVRFSTREEGGRAEVTLTERSSDGGDWLRWLGRSDEEWTIELSPDLPLDLDLDCGSGSGEFDLRELQLRNLMVDGGSGAFELILPAEWGMAVHLDVGSGSAVMVLPDSGSGDLTVDGGTGSLTMHLPRGMAARVELQSGTGSFQADSRFELVQGDREGDGIWETEGYEGAEKRMLLRIDQGTGSVTIANPGG